MSLIKREQVPARAEHAVERLGVLLQRLRILPQHLGDADDGVERRAQLVAHIGEELRLVLACLGELAALVLDFVEQPHVLDRDHRLVGEGRDQLDLLVGERPHVGARQHDHADRHAFSQQRHAEHGAKAARSSVLRSECIPDRPAHRDMNGLAFQHRAPDYAILVPAGTGCLLHEFLELARIPVACDVHDRARPSRRVMARHVRLAQPRRRLDQRIEHRLQIEGRAADDLEHVGGGGLLLQRFAQLVEQPRVLDGDDGLGGEVRAPARSACR